LFSYDEFVIKSSVPLSDIRSYFREIGAFEKLDAALDKKPDGALIVNAVGNPGDELELEYEYSADGFDLLDIRISIGVNEALKSLKVPMHTIRVCGGEDSAKKFLDDYRLKFLSAGG